VGDVPDASLTPLLNFRPVRWRSRLLPAALVAVLLVGSSGVAAVSAWRLETKVVALFHLGQGHLDRGKALLSTANKLASPALLDQARVEFDAAARNFRDGRLAIDSSPLARYGAKVPAAGRLVDSRVQAVDSLADMGLRLCHAGQRAIDVDDLFLRPASGQPQGSRHLLDVLDQAVPLIQGVRADLRAAAAAAQSVDPSVLPGSQRASLLQARTTLQRSLAGLDSFDRFLPVVRDLLGASRPSTYLIEQVNPFELRAGGGYIGTYSLVAADRGSLSLLKSGDTHTLPEWHVLSGSPGYVAPPPALLDFVDDTSWNLGDSNFFPGFPANAQAAESFAPHDFAQRIDGVFAIDLYAVAALLQVTGPLAIPGEGLTVTSDNLVPLLARLDILDPAHKQVLAALAGPLIERLTTLDAAHWPQLVTVLNEQAGERHLQVYFNDSRDQAEMVGMGLAGDLSFGGAGDFLGLVESNFGGNKANYFLTRKLRLELTRAGSTLHHVLVEDLALDLTSAPASYNVPYRAYFRLLVPDRSTARSIRPVKPDDHPYGAPPPGTSLIDGWQQLNPDPGSRKGSLQIVYAWDTPWTQDADGRHAVYVQKQPGTARDALEVMWNDGGRTATATTDLGVDRVLSLGTDGVRIGRGQVARAELPRLGL
jgi:hypothetical protein